MSYSQYLELHNRLAGKKKISIIKSECVGACIEQLVSDENIDRKYRAIIIVALSGGLRINEALSLTRSSFEFDQSTGELYAAVNVLKKRRDEQRIIKIHPSATQFIRNYLSEVLRPFDSNERTMLRVIKRIFECESICNHSLRHSLISLLLDKNLSHLKISKLIHVNVKAIEFYSHINYKKVLGEVF